jgi:multidrug efflux pump
MPGIQTEMLEAAEGPGEGKPMNLRLESGDNWETFWPPPTDRAGACSNSFDGLVEMEDTLPLPGIDWQIDVDVEAAGRFGADVAHRGRDGPARHPRHPSGHHARAVDSDDEIEIRVRFPEEARVLSTLDTIRSAPDEGLVPLSNFVRSGPAPQLWPRSAASTERIFEVKADRHLGRRQLGMDRRPGRVGAGRKPGLPPPPSPARWG